MDDRDYIILLYDYYMELFNDKQREYFEYYYFNNLSLGEISDNILFYEDKLKLCSKSKMIKELIKDIDNVKLKSRIEELL